MVFQEKLNVYPAVSLFLNTVVFFKKVAKADTVVLAIPVEEGWQIGTKYLLQILSNDLYDC